MEAHTRFEESGEEEPPDDLLEPLRGSRTLARDLARDLGHRLGRVLFDLVRSGRTDACGLRRLFTRTLDPESAPGTVTRYLRGELPIIREEE